MAPPGPGLDPALALALGVSSSPGAYAMLLGSGISRAAQVPTGWEVVLDLIRKVAALQGEDAAEEALADPEGWWQGQGYGDPRYDTLLEALAPSVTARRDLLHAYFEPADDAQREAGIKQPTTAHRAIAELASSGRIRLILTTNFDHLMETALAEAGVPPQVIARADAIDGMAPLQHARVTVIKLHGDYLDVQAIRNTPAELAAYDPKMNDLLAGILDEYGLIALGWSGEWDTALIHAIENCPTRRYPTYWAAYRGLMSPAAARLLAGRAGHLIPIDGADSFCDGLRDKVGALARMADPPPTRAVAVATLKRNLRPDRRVELFDQLNMITGRTIDRLTPDRYPAYKSGALTREEAAVELGRQLADYDSDTEVLTALAAAGIFHGPADDVRVDNLILRAVRRLADQPRPPGTVPRFPAGCAALSGVAAGDLRGCRSHRLRAGGPAVSCPRRSPVPEFRVLWSRGLTGKCPAPGSRIPQRRRGRHRAAVRRPWWQRALAGQPLSQGQLPGRAGGVDRRTRVRRRIRPIRIPPGNARDRLRRTRRARRVREPNRRAEPSGHRRNHRSVATDRGRGLRR